MIHATLCATPGEVHDYPCRDKKGQPRIYAPDGKFRSYARSSNYGKVLEDLNGLMKWKCRMTAFGAFDEPALLTLINQDRDDKDRVDALVGRLMDSAGASKQNRRGTAVHSLTEAVDQGVELSGLPPMVAEDLRAYRNRLDEHEVEPVKIEGFCVNDELRCAGTFDRVVRIDGQNYIADLKTSTSVDYPHSWAVQLAVYAHSSYYNFHTYERSSLEDVDQQQAVLIWLPAEQAKCELFWIDIAKGWEIATTLVPAMKAWRSEKHLLTPF